MIGLRSRRRRLCLAALMVALLGVLTPAMLGSQRVQAINSPTPQWMPESQTFASSDVQFSDGLHGWGVDINALQETTDGGLSWSTLMLPPGDYYSRVLVTGPSHLYVAGENTIIESTDNGMTWSAPHHPPVQYNDLTDIAS